MLNKLIGNSLYSADRLYTFGRDIYTHHFKKKFDDKMVMFSDLGNVNEKSLHAMKTIGRVVGDGTVTTKLTKNSVHLIDGDDATVRMVELDLSQMHSFALFPGQTIMVQGTNPSGKLFHVQQVITDRLLERNESSLSEPVNMVIVSGPYTNENDLAYEPLHDVINYCKKHKPNILIMIGPFLHERHTSIQNGTLRESFDVYFEKIIAGIMDAVGKDTQVLVVSSAQDAHSTSVYPTHPYRLSREYSNLTLLPDPCTVDIGGFLIGITSTDIVKHISDTEVTSNAGEKLKRIVNYLLYQGAFYPLDPPDVNVYLDIELADKYGQMRIIPNMLILPSDLRYFIRDIDNCLVVNPGHAADVNGGTMNRIVVYPKKDETSLQNHVFSQIIKI